MAVLREQDIYCQNCGYFSLQIVNGKTVCMQCGVSDTSSKVNSHGPTCRLCGANMRFIGVIWECPHCDRTPVELKPFSKPMKIARRRPRKGRRSVA